MTLVPVIIPKLRCMTCAGTPTIIPDENQSPEDAGLQHLILHEEDVEGPHELSSRYVLGYQEIEEFSKAGGDEEQLEQAPEE